MAIKSYTHRSWRELPREGECALVDLIGGECRGALGWHHIHPLSEDGNDEDGLLLACQRHHQLLHGARRRALPQWRRCRHTHRTRESRLLCERRLNTG